MAVKYKQGKEAQDAILSGVKQLASIVTTTLGPKGRNVSLDKLWNAPSVIHDGVSVAKEIDLPDPFENMAAQLVKEAATKTSDRAGDGTTTSTLLAWKLVERGIDQIRKGTNPMMLKEGMDIASQEIIKYLDTKSQPVKDNDIKKIATISSTSIEIGERIAEALEKVGPNGVISVEEGQGVDTTTEYKEGMMFDKGYGSPAFVTNQKDMTCVIEKPLILFTDMIIDSVDDFAGFLGKIRDSNNRNIVIIADSFQGYTLPTLIENTKRGIFRSVAIPAPMFGIKRLWMLEDMALLTGGTVITKQSGKTLESVDLGDLGRADSLWCDKDNTKIIGGYGNKRLVEERIKNIKSQIALEESDFEKKSLLDRIAKLSNGVAIIKVGALTETELKDKKERIIDAVEATKSALAEGIIAGGGVALLQCQTSMPRHLSDDPEINQGIDLVMSVLDQPIVKILDNAGVSVVEILLKIAEQKQENYGYDIVKNQYGDMYDMGIIDPVRVTKQAVQNAISVASMLLTMEVMVTKIEETKKSPIEDPRLIQ